MRNTEFGSSESQKQRDRRISSRVWLSTPSTCRLSSSAKQQEEFQGVIRNLSSHGVCVLLRQETSARTVLAVELLRSGRGDPSIRIPGEVIWQRPAPAINGHVSGYMTGIRFSTNKALAIEIGEVIRGTLQREEVTLNDLLNKIAPAPRIDKSEIQTTLFRTSCARIVATGGLLPRRVVQNQEIVEEQQNLFDMIVRRALGAVERRSAALEETNAVMMAEVAHGILASAGVQPSELTKVICSSDPQDQVAPNVACVVQSKIGASCPAFDVQMSCAGWLCGVEQGLRGLEGGDSCVLVLASSVVGSRLKFYNRRDRAIFGDGASGVLLKAEPNGNGNLMVMELWTEGRFYNEIFAPLPWSPKPSNIPQEYAGSFYMSPNQDLFFETLSRVLPTFFERLLKKAGVKVRDINHFLLHQPTMPLFYHSLKVLSEIPREKVFDCYARFGNIVAAEMPMMLHDGIQSGRIQRGDLVLMLTYGAGFTMAGWLFEY